MLRREEIIRALGIDQNIPEAELILLFTSITNSLNDLFTVDIAFIWLHEPNKLLEGLSPSQYSRTHKQGIKKIARLLDIIGR